VKGGGLDSSNLGNSRPNETEGALQKRVK